VEQIQLRRPLRVTCGGLYCAIVLEEVLFGKESQALLQVCRREKVSHCLLDLFQRVLAVEQRDDRLLELSE
jgi:hypothetical protein